MKASHVVTVRMACCECGYEWKAVAIGEASGIPTTSDICSRCYSDDIQRGEVKREILPMILLPQNLSKEVWCD